MHDDPVSSASNPLVKRLVRLRERRARQREGVALVEGARELMRAVDAGAPLELLVRCPELFSDDARAAAERVERAARERRTFSRAAFERASMRQGPDGLMGLVTPPTRSLADVAMAADGRYLVLAALEKPGNVGALLRTASATGVRAVFLTGRGADPWNPNVIRASMGSVFSVTVVPADDGELREALRRQGVRVVATSPTGGVPYWDADLTGAVAIVVGREHEGLESGWLAASDLQVSIPMSGPADSLNAATAGALVLYEAVRQAAFRSRAAPPPAPT